MTRAESQEVIRLRLTAKALGIDPDTAAGAAGRLVAWGLSDIEAASDLKALIGAEQDRREAARLKKLANRNRGKKAKARKLERLAAASRKRNRGRT